MSPLNRGLDYGKKSGDASTAFPFPPWPPKQKHKKEKGEVMQAPRKTDYGPQTMMPFDKACKDRVP